MEEEKKMYYINYKFADNGVFSDTVLLTPQQAKLIEKRLTAAEESGYVGDWLLGETDKLWDFDDLWDTMDFHDVPGGDDDEAEADDEQALAILKAAVLD